MAPDKDDIAKSTTYIDITDGKEGSGLTQVGFRTAVVAAATSAVSPRSLPAATSIEKRRITARDGLSWQFPA